MRLHILRNLDLLFSYDILRLFRVLPMQLKAITSPRSTTGQ
jgi:hypothetical protein